MEATEKLTGFNGSEHKYTIEFITTSFGKEKEYQIGKENLDKIEFTKFWENLTPGSKLVVQAIIKNIQNA